MLFFGYVQKLYLGKNSVTDAVKNLIQEEISLGMNTKDYYSKFQSKIYELKNEIIKFILSNQDKRIAGYGAAAKGNTLLNYCGIKSNSIDFVVDKNLHKQGKFLPGSRIRILPVEDLNTIKPELILVFPWNIADEIKNQLAYTKEWGCRIYTLIPEIKELNYE